MTWTPRVIKEYQDGRLIKSSIQRTEGGDLEDYPAGAMAEHSFMSLWDDYTTLKMKIEDMDEKAKPLSDEEIEQILIKARLQYYKDKHIPIVNIGYATSMSLFDFARAIEKAHGIE